MKKADVPASLGIYLVCIEPFDINGLPSADIFIDK